MITRPLYIPLIPLLLEIKGGQMIVQVSKPWCAYRVNARRIGAWLYFQDMQVGQGFSEWVHGTYRVSTFFLRDFIKICILKILL